VPAASSHPTSGRFVEIQPRPRRSHARVIEKLGGLSSIRLPLVRRAHRCPQVRQELHTHLETRRASTASRVSKHSGNACPQFLFLLLPGKGQRQNSELKQPVSQTNKWSPIQNAGRLPVRATWCFLLRQNSNARCRGRLMASTGAAVRVRLSSRPSSKS